MKQSTKQVYIYVSLIRLFVNLNTMSTS